MRQFVGCRYRRDGSMLGKSGIICQGFFLLYFFGLLPGWLGSLAASFRRREAGRCVGWWNQSSRQSALAQKIIANPEEHLIHAFFFE